MESLFKVWKHNAPVAAAQHYCMYYVLRITALYLSNHGTHNMEDACRTSTVHNAAKSPERLTLRLFKTRIQAETEQVGIFSSCQNKVLTVRTTA